MLLCNKTDIFYIVTQEHDENEKNPGNDPHITTDGRTPY